MNTAWRLNLFILILGQYSYSEATDTKDWPPYIDTHFHLMEVHKMDFDPFLLDQEYMQNENYSPSRFDADVFPTPVRYGIVVDAAEDQQAELDYTIEASCCHESLVGVVAGLPLDDPEFEDKINQYNNGRGKRMLRGIRNWRKSAADHYARKDLWPGIRVLERKGLVLDLIVRPLELQHINVIPEAFPNLKIVINHMALPFEEPDKEREWKDGITNIARYPNVFMKISGVLNEDALSLFYHRGPGPNPRSTYGQFQPKAQHIKDAFGVDRIMYASNWPVDLVAFQNYTEIYHFVEKNVNLDGKDKEKFFRLNAINIYGLTLNYPTCGGVSSLGRESQKLAYLVVFSVVAWWWMESK